MTTLRTHDTVRISVPCFVFRSRAPGSAAQGLSSVVFSNNSRLLASAGQSGLIEVWNLEKKEVAKTLKVQPGSPARALSLGVCSWLVLPVLMIALLRGKERRERE